MKQFFVNTWATILRVGTALIAVFRGAGQGMTVLDAGCGEGYYTAELARTLREAGFRPGVSGIDISKAALQEAVMHRLFRWRI